MDRDTVLAHALKEANKSRIIMQIGQREQEPAEWIAWSYGNSPVWAIIESTIRYVLPKGEVTKLS